MRLARVGAFLGALHATVAAAGQATVSIRYVGVPTTFTGSGSPTLGSVEVSVIQGPNGCEYRLEFNDPDVKTNWSLSEIAGDQGSPQRYVNATCTPPAFTAGPTDSMRQYEEQSAYYWAKQARDYAVRRLWITPPGSGAFKLANDGLGVSVETDGLFSRSCLPNVLSGCMRDWPHEGPKIHLRAGVVNVNLMAHEFGHYAGGFVFGHMDTVSPGNTFDATQCDIRSFQEAVADVFEVLFMHEIGGLRAFGGAGTTQWTNTCGANDRLMGRPLAEAVEDAVRGVAANTALNFSWSSPAEANEALASAFAYGLGNTTGHKIDMLAYAMLRWLEANRPQRAAQVRAMFAAHGMAPMPSGVDCTTNQGCASGYCDRGDGTSKTGKCVPGPEAGAIGEFCSHDHHCRTLNCGGLVFVNGAWQGGTCASKVAIGGSCTQHGQCASGNCDAGWSTSQTNICVPAQGTGAGGQPCAKHAHCRSGLCTGMTRNAAGGWNPGTCSSQAGLKAPCSNHSDCASGNCDAGWNSSQTNTCMPNGNGARGDPCTQHKHCASQVCSGVTASGNRWLPGTCN